MKPAAHLDRLDEVLVITSTEPRFSPQEQQDIDRQRISKERSPAINDQMKASEIMAEKLPGLIDPNLPADQQPLHDTSNPNPATRPPQPLHPDEFSPARPENLRRSTGRDSTRKLEKSPDLPHPPHQAERPAPASNPKPQAAPQRNP